MTADNEKIFLEWIDKEIEKADDNARQENQRVEPNYCYEGRMNALQEAREKFIALTPPPTTK